MITPTKPGTLIRRGKQRLNLRTREEMYLRSRKPLTGNGENALDLGGVVRLAAGQQAPAEWSQMRETVA